MSSQHLAVSFAVAASFVMAACGAPPPEVEVTSASSAVESSKDFLCSCIEVNCTTFGRRERYEYEGDRGIVRAASAKQAEAQTIALEKSNAMSFCQIQNPEMTAARCAYAACEEASRCRALSPSDPKGTSFCITCGPVNGRIQTLSMNAESEECARELVASQCGDANITVDECSGGAGSGLSAPGSGASAPQGPGAGAP